MGHKLSITVSDSGFAIFSCFQTDMLTVLSSAKTLCNFLIVHAV